MRARARLAFVVAAFLTFALVLGNAAMPGTAQAASPVYAVTSVHSPTNFVPGDESGTATYTISVTNAGGAPTDGSPITVTDTLPPGFTVDTTPSGFGFFALLDDGLQPGSCNPGTPTTCVAPPGSVRPGGVLTMIIPVDVPPNAPATVTNRVSVSGGGAPAASTTEQAAVSTDVPPFGFQSAHTAITDADGAPVTQAGSHPYQFHTDFQINTKADLVSTVANPPVGTIKDVTTKLPEGLIIDPNATPVRCTEVQLESNGAESSCPDASAVGVVHPTVGLFGFPNPLTAGAVYNMVPPPGVPAELAFNAAGAGIFVHLLGRVDTAGNYAFTADVKDLLEYGTTAGVSIDLWGDPSDPSHDYRRGKCAIAIHFGTSCPVSATDTPLLTMPSACSESLAEELSADSWQDPGNFATGSAETADLSGHPVGVQGCSRLSFDPRISVQPTTTVADSPTGLDIDLQVPQTDGLSSLATSSLRTATVILPRGVSVNPSSAEGLQACSQAEIGLHSAAEPACPEASKIGTVEITTPLLADHLQGAVYLAKQTDNPFGSLLAIYVAAEADGALIKLAGEITLDPSTGQLETTFDSNPQVPFSDLKLHFKGGPRGSLATPDSCDSYSAQSSLAPWSGDPPTLLSSSFAINSGCTGGFSPSFTAGSTNPVAGSHNTALHISLMRADGQQHIARMTAVLPPGLTAKVAGVPLCPDAQAAIGTCDDSSQIGTTTDGAGAGPSPFFLAGKVFLTGPYGGGPFGLSIVVPAIAGPFDLGNVVVRAALMIDPTDGHVTAVSGEIPRILQGIPLRVRSIAVDIDRPGFIINPTSCTPMQASAAVASFEGDVAQVTDRFQVSDCAGLPFKPSFSASTQGNGNFHRASLDVKISQRPGEAAIHGVETQLPLALPSRLVTLQKACNGAQFDANPAGCPADSIVGVAKALTPILSAPLTGPAILVSHGGAAFPDIDLVLQGEGVRIVLTGNTDIKKGITYSRFETVPDAPISSFELKLPATPNAVLAATKNLCSPTKVVTAAKRVTRRVNGHVRHLVVKVKRRVAEPLLMPTTITGQNGAVLRQTVHVAVTGCAKPKSTAGKTRRSARRKPGGKRS